MIVPALRTKIAGAPWHTYVIIGVLIGIGVCASLALTGWTKGFFGAALAAICILIAFCDWRSFIIPNELNALGVAIGLVAAATASDGVTHALMMAALRASVAASLFLALRGFYYWWRGQQGLGLGDVKLAAVAGVWLDWPILPYAIEVAAFAALAAYIVAQVVFRKPLTAQARLPFGVFLAPAIWLCWILAVSAHVQS